jgi:DNA-binding transcriptional LysR family regulator
VALVPTLAAGHAAGSPVVLRPISDHPVARRVSALTAPQAERSPATRAMLEVLREVSATR